VGKQLKQSNHVCSMEEQNDHSKQIIITIRPTRLFPSLLQSVFQIG